MCPFQDFGKGADNQGINKGWESFEFQTKKIQKAYITFMFSLKVERSLSIPKNTQEFKEIVLNKIVPESLVKPCVVRCKVNQLLNYYIKYQINVPKNVNACIDSNCPSINNFKIYLKSPSAFFILREEL